MKPARAGSVAASTIDRGGNSTRGKAAALAPKFNSTTTRCPSNARA